MKRNLEERDWKILDLLKNAGERGISKNKLDEKANDIASPNTIITILENLHNDQYINYPPKGQGWRKGQSRIARITEKGKRALQKHQLTIGHNESMPDHLESIPIPPDEILEVARKDRRDEINYKIKLAERVGESISKEEKDKIEFFAVELRAKAAETVANSLKIFLAYPENDPVELPKSIKEKFIRKSIDLFLFTNFKLGVNGLMPRRTPFRIIIEQPPRKIEANERSDFQTQPFNSWMKRFHPEIKISKSGNLPRELLSKYYFEYQIDFADYFFL